MVVHYIGYCTSHLFLSPPKLISATRTSEFDSDSHRHKHISFFWTFLLESSFFNNKTSPSSTYHDAIHVFCLFLHSFTCGKLILGGGNSTSFMQNAAECEELNQSHCNSYMHYVDKIDLQLPVDCILIELMSFSLVLFLDQFLYKGCSRTTELGQYGKPAPPSISVSRWWAYRVTY